TVALGLGLAAFFVLKQRVAAFGVASALMGSPAEVYEQCTRSFECFPRALLRWVAHQNTAAWAVGLVFRALSGLWLVYAAFQSARTGRKLPWLAAGLFGHYLFLHGFF